MSRQSRSLVWAIITFILLCLGMHAFGQTQAVSGSVTNPNGSGFTGTFGISLTKTTVVNICVTPAQAVPFPGLTVRVNNGTFPSTNLLPTDCLSPRLPYYVQIKDPTGKLLFSDNWYVARTLSGTTDVGTMGDVQMASGITVAVPLAIISTPPGNQTVTQPGSTNLIVNNLLVTNLLGFSGALSPSSITTNTVSASTSITTPLLTATTLNATNITATLVNAANYEVSGHPLSAADLSNGVSGTGAICLVTGSACGGGGSSFYQTVQSNGIDQTQRANLSFSSNFVLSDSLSNNRTSVEFAAAGSAGTYTCPSSLTTDIFGRTTAVSSGTCPAASSEQYISFAGPNISGSGGTNNISSGTQTATFSPAQPDTGYVVEGCMVVNTTGASDFATVLSITSPTTFNYVVQQVQNNGGNSFSMTLHCHLHHP